MNRREFTVALGALLTPISGAAIALSGQLPDRIIFGDFGHIDLDIASDGRTIDGIGKFHTGTREIFHVVPSGSKMHIALESDPEFVQTVESSIETFRRRWLAGPVSPQAKA